MRNHLRALRVARGWTQAVLADELDVSRQTINALETGRYDPSLPLAFALSRLFEQPIESIFDPEPARPNVPQGR
ncbi:Xre family transcriptional regulator [Antricoccus suffuscus]|uniref:Xre family transcriptional regulator n=1 Tax=Antricoccus suffuscus TaxID=1629062 RepID=A0A2T1A283_9ACTN|nr:helix-turn-helix transcriptional regulator [Antricoccus suffuscus]PRZ42720.1 Xre family transcriptional regulator [Antricoccus suffuscus]